MEGRREVRRSSNSRTTMNTRNSFLPSSFSIREVKGKEGKELLFFWVVRWLWFWVFIRLLAVKLSRCCCWWPGWSSCCTWWWRWPAARLAALAVDGGTVCGTGWWSWPVAGGCVSAGSRPWPWCGAAAGGRAGQAAAPGGGGGQGCSLPPSKVLPALSTHGCETSSKSR